MLVQFACFSASLHHSILSCSIHSSIRVRCQLFGQLQCLVSILRSKTPIFARVNVSHVLVCLFQILVLVVLARQTLSKSKYSLLVGCHSSARHGPPNENVFVRVCESRYQYLQICAIGELRDMPFFKATSR